MDRRSFLLATLGAASATCLPAPAFALARAGSTPRPTAALVTAWDRDPWARGAYSALPPGVSPAVREVISAALVANRVAFAGEYVSVDAPATTNGAYATGRNAAKRLLSRAQPRTAVVIGAGIAGAAAAQALAAAGVDVTVLEARDRIGGRIRSDMTWGVPVELGAAWIHGTTGNPVTALARADGLGLVQTDYDDLTVRDTVTGRESPQGDAARDAMGERMDELVDSEVPRSSSIAQWLRAQGWQPNRFTTWSAEVEVTQEYGLAPSTLGVRAVQEGEDQRGPDALVQGGYAHIPGTLLTGIEVQLNTPVTRVAVDGRTVRVTLRDGRVRAADAVVVAVPLALLQQRVIRVDPMPRPVWAAIGALRTGDLEKVILRYDEAWWDDATVIGVVGGGAPGAPAGSLNALRWTECFSLTDLLGFPALVGFSGGAAAMARPRSSSACVQEMVAALDAAYAHA